ncbi:MAG: heparinase II/III family protein [Acidobacteria bacterium]|nr:heparinase II/III family protein [Acidobacteriota bacterium]
MTRSTLATALLLGSFVARPCAAQDVVPSFDQLLSQNVSLKPELVGIHPRVFVTKTGLVALRERARTTHRSEWSKVLANLAAMKGAPPPVPGPQERRSQNNVAFAIAEAALAYAVEGKPEYLTAARAWTLAGIDYEPWGYTYNKPNTDLAAGHLLYAIGWAYDLLYDDFSAAERARIRASLERHANLVYDAFAPKTGGAQPFTQNHAFIPTAGLAVTALALMGESKDAERWALLARAHHHRAGQLLSPDGYYYEGFEYWIFSTPWLVHFLDAWEHATGESLWDRDLFRNWKTYLAHTLLPDGQSVVDFGDIWEGALTRSKAGPDYERAYPGGTLQSNFNVMYRVAARLQDPEAQAVADRYAAFRHSNLEEYWTLLWRDPGLQAAPVERLPLAHHFKDSGVVYSRTSWNTDATVVAFKAGPPEGHRVAALLPKLPEWRLDSGHAHPDAGSFIVWAQGRYLTGDTGYAGLPSARNHNTLTFGGTGQGVETQHDVWRQMDYRALDGIRIREADLSGGRVRIVADLAAAYPPAAGVDTFVRTFTWDGAAVFTVADTVVRKTPGTAEWHLQSDTPFEGTGQSYHNGTAGEVALRVSFTSPANVSVTVGEARVKAPGPPGSIEKGPEERRGHALRATTAPAASQRFEVRLEILRTPARPSNSRRRRGSVAREFRHQAIPLREHEIEPDRRKDEEMKMRGRHRHTGHGPAQIAEWPPRGEQ